MATENGPASMNHRVRIVIVVAVGLAVGIAYFSLARLLEAMGGVGQMPPPFAAFAPDLIFYFAGMYFFFKMPT